MAFTVVVGAEQGLKRLLFVVGVLEPGQVSPVHLHYGEEILIVSRGRIRLRLGDDRHECGPGSTIMIPAGTWHGFQALEEAELHLMAEQQIGTVYPVLGEHGIEPLEVYRPELPWGRPPPEG